MSGATEAADKEGPHPPEARRDEPKQGLVRRGREWVPGAFLDAGEALAAG
ncbi:hypothetical protein [Pyrodictium abyssi]|uniref:Uncharacterized protein n=1 Tax=Pyrodictium abyssi TaxID=54256 RepID=A0ABM8IZ85_9CREN|nr:hypothetical protein PABY_24070 [Pyrodictium abyssi]